MEKFKNACCSFKHSEGDIVSPSRNLISDSREKMQKEKSLCCRYANEHAYLTIVKKSSNKNSALEWYPMVM